MTVVIVAFKSSYGWEVFLFVAKHISPLRAMNGSCPCGNALGWIDVFLARRCADNHICSQAGIAI